MQKDFHFYVTYALARGAGIGAKAAQEIAWANQYTDDLTEAQLYGIQTQVGTISNWGDRQIQLSVLIPYHFIPGGVPGSDWPWEVTENNPRARALVQASMTRARDVKRFALGIALHGLQDTFSHQGFSGWRESNNSCGFWYLLPNIGHADMRHEPDVVDHTWTDPRTKKRIINRPRALRAAKETFNVLAGYNGLTPPASKWANLKKKLTEIFKEKSYDKRKQRLAKLAGKPGFRYSKLTKRAQEKHGEIFVRAAVEHLSDAVSLVADL